MANSQSMYNHHSKIHYASSITKQIHHEGANQKVATMDSRVPMANVIVIRRKKGTCRRKSVVLQSLWPALNADGVPKAIVQKTRNANTSGKKCQENASARVELGSSALGDRCSAAEPE